MHFEIRHPVAVHIALQHAVGAGDQAQLPGDIAETRRADPGEGLVGGQGAVGVDPGQVDQVKPRLEAPDEVAQGRSGGAVGKAADLSVSWGENLARQHADRHRP